MSPRRKLEPRSSDFIDDFPRVRRRRRWGLKVASTCAAGAASCAAAVCLIVLDSHLSQSRTTLREVAALGYVRSFMTEFTSPDPFHANDYAERILAQATGDFAQQYRQNENAILVGVAQSEPTTGTVLDAGISRWNDDGSVDVLVVTKFSSKSPDGKLTMERTNRWVVTAKPEGDGWKINSVIPSV
ncbi:mammalian cell entry protein [Mycolicibacterium sp.]|uniref:mammalian cell entry protein n=1 Tax=Mycolicibacterium sp. TaxID=2320850 RepID=UPI0037C912E0